MSALDTAQDRTALGRSALARDRTRELLGKVMGVVAITVGLAALGAYLGRDLSGVTGLVLFVGAFATIIGLHVATARGREQLALGLLFGMGLLLGLAVAPVVADFAGADSSALWRAAGATAAFVAAFGAYGYATRRYRPPARPLGHAMGHDPAGNRKPTVRRARQLCVLCRDFRARVRGWEHMIPRHELARRRHPCPGN